MNSISASVVYNLPVGNVLILADKSYLRKLVFLDYEKPYSLKIDLFSKNVILDKAENFLKNYFYRKVWYPFEYIDYQNLNEVLMQLMNVQFGQFLYYSDFKKHPRAVGKILSKNEIPIFIPCHRVISKHSIGGYTPSIIIKRILLEHEAI